MHNDEGTPIVGNGRIAECFIKEWSDIHNLGKEGKQVMSFSTHLISRTVVDDNDNALLSALMHAFGFSTDWCKLIEHCTVFCEGVLVFDV